MDTPNSSEIFEKIAETGDIEYAIRVLSLIWSEELCEMKRKNVRGVELFSSGTSFEVQKYSKDKLLETKRVGINLDGMPDFLKDKLLAMGAVLMRAIVGIADRLYSKKPERLDIANSDSEESLKKLNIKEEFKEFLKEFLKGFLKSLISPDLKFDLKGKLTLTYTREVSQDNERYILQASETISLPNLIKKRRGPRGSPQSNVAIFLFDRYFQRIGLKRKHEAIAAFCNDFSGLFFKVGSGAPLSPDNVRKRIQWVKKRKSLVEYAEKFEKEKLITLNS